MVAAMKESRTTAQIEAEINRRIRDLLVRYMDCSTVCAG